MICSLDRSDDDKEQASTLIHNLRSEGLITGENFMQVRRPTITKEVGGLLRYIAQDIASPSPPNTPNILLSTGASLP